MPNQYRPEAADHPWEKIFARDGRVFTEQLPALEEAAGRFTAQGCRRVMDLGCGNGRHVVALAAHGFQVLGLDISRTGLELTQEWLGEMSLDASLLQSDTRHPLPLSGSCLDGLMSTQVIHHALSREVRLAISEIHRVLRPGGLAFVTVPCRPHSRERSRKIERNTFLPLEGSEAGLPHHIFSKKRLRQAFRAFNILEISYRDSGRVLAVWAEKPP